MGYGTGFEALGAAMPPSIRKPGFRPATPGAQRLALAGPTRYS